MNRIGLKNRKGKYSVINRLVNLYGLRINFLTSCLSDTTIVEFFFPCNSDWDKNTVIINIVYPHFQNAYFITTFRCGIYSSPKNRVIIQVFRKKNLVDSFFRIIKIRYFKCYINPFVPQFLKRFNLDRLVCQALPDFGFF